ncbi:MAG: helical backbone metal receptor [Gemmatimonadetes bacterium]|nr:helical backbone metal receptor [Gemmatimonadota bacterium]
MSSLYRILSSSASPHRTLDRVAMRLIAAAGVAIMGAACADSNGQSSVETESGGAPSAFVDDLGDTVAVGIARRIVSLNPVTTEFLFAAGAGPRVVGRTHWDLYPAEAAAVPDLGNGIGPNVEAVVGARPDLVILYATVGNQRAVAALHAAGVRTLSIRTDRIDDLRRFANAYARVTGDSGGIVVADSVLASVEAVRQMPRPLIAPRVFWRMGDPPLFTAGSGSFVGELIELAGGSNVFGDISAPSPQVSLEEVVRRNPDLIIVGPTGAERIAESAAWRVIPAVRAGRVVVFDTALVARPGVRLGEAARHVRELIYGRGGR